jgi:DNA-binding response OmpR family regulator
MDRKRILLLEDERETREMISEILEQEGYEVSASGQCQSVEKTMEFKPDLILLNVKLSDGYGSLLCQDLKRNAEAAKIPVILVSGAPDLLKIALEYHADNYLNKPFSIQELIDIVKLYDVSQMGYSQMAS